MCQTSTMGSVVLFSMVPHLPSAGPCFRASSQGFPFRTVCTAAWTVPRWGYSAMEQAGLKSSWHFMPFSPVSLHLSLSLPRHLIYIIDMYPEWLVGWISEGTDGWMNEMKPRAHCWTRLCLIHCLLHRGIKNWYNSVEGNVIKIKSSKPFPGIYPRDIFVRAWNDVCIRLFHFSFVCNSKTLEAT